MNERGFSPEGSGEEPTEPTPEEVGEVLRTIFVEVLAEASKEDKELLKGELADTGILFVPKGNTEAQLAELDREKVQYDPKESLEEILGHICDGYIQGLQSGDRDITETMEDAITVVETLGGDSNIVIEKLTEIGVLE